MIEQIVKPLDWCYPKTPNAGYICSAKTLFAEYEVQADGSKYKVKYTNTAESEPAKDATGWLTEEDAKNWAYTNHCKKILPMLNLNIDLIGEYVAKFTQWSTDRKIIQNGNLQTQTLKFVSEGGELADNIAKGRDTKDDIGDCFVVMNNLVEMQGYTWQECLEQAWNDIKDRKGYMNEYGVFIKEGDSE